MLLPGEERYVMTATYMATCGSDPVKVTAVDVPAAPGSINSSVSTTPLPQRSVLQSIPGNQPTTIILTQNNVYLHPFSGPCTSQTTVQQNKVGIASLDRQPTLVR
jgi:hypothetical protein